MASPQKEYSVTVDRVVDGDTVVVSIQLGFGVVLTEQWIRMAGIDAPEKRGKERELGLESTLALRSKLDAARAVTIKTDGKKGKYGRYIATLFADGEDLCEWLVSSGLAEREDYK
jgi:micrococcal nuclease